MLILSVFTDSGVLKTGLTPTIKIYDLIDSSLVVDGEACIEVAEGAYKYDFVAYDENKDYYILVDGGIALNNVDRYKFSGNMNNVLEQLVVNLDSTLTDIKGAGFSKESASLAAIRTRGDDAWKTSIRDCAWQFTSAEEALEKIKKILKKLEELLSHDEYQKLLENFEDLKARIEAAKTKIDELHPVKDRISSIEGELLKKEDRLIERIESLSGREKIELPDYSADLIQLIQTVKSLEGRLLGLNEKVDIIEELAIKSSSDEALEEVIAENNLETGISAEDLEIKPEGADSNVVSN